MNDDDKECLNIERTYQVRFASPAGDPIYRGLILRGDYTPAFEGDHTNPAHPSDLSIRSVELKYASIMGPEASLDVLPLLRAGSIKIPDMDRYIQEAINHFGSEGREETLKMNELSKADRDRFEFMREYAERRLRGEKPAWQCRKTGEVDWGDVQTKMVPIFGKGNEYRFAPKTIKINGI